MKEKPEPTAALSRMNTEIFVASPSESVADLGVEEDLRAEEPLVADVDGEALLGDGVDAVVLLDVLVGVLVELVELFGDVRAHVAVALLKKSQFWFGTVTTSTLLSKSLTEKKGLLKVNKNGGENAFFCSQNTS